MGEVLKVASVPLFTGAIGYLTNWSGVWMLFYPVQFAGFKLPGLLRLVRFMPRRIQQIPGVMLGGVGWQGIIPSRAAKMGSIAVDKGIAKLGTPHDFYEQLDPDAIAEHMLTTARGDMHDLVERVMEREHPQLWNNAPEPVRAAVHERVQQQLPDIVKDVTDQIGANIDQLLDVKLMVIRHIEAHPELANRIFLEVGRNELKFIVNFGFWFGLVQGIPLVVLTTLVPEWWILPVGGVIIGYATNWVALWMIFQPTEPRQVFGHTIQGLFLKRQPEVSGVYGKIIADDIVTIKNMGEELLHGPSGDRTRQMIYDALRPAVDRASGFVAPAVRVAVGPREYDAIRESVATEGVEYTITPFADPDFNERQSAKVRTLVTDRMKEMGPADFAELLRSAMREDEWLLLLHGGVLGFGAGCLHLAIFGT